MHITEALARAAEARLVYALLAAYFEAVQCHDSGLTVPATITRLPLHGESDVNRRYAEARILHSRCLGETGRNDALMAEIADVLGAALVRLHELLPPLERAA